MQMSAVRGEFSSRLGFLMAAAGAAVGLGNLVSFPTLAANNGGAAFLITYLVMTFLIAYPALMAELIIGRHSKANAVKALQSISSNATTARIGAVSGFGGIFAGCLILSFYLIIAGWMLSHALGSASAIVGASGASQWLSSQSIERNLVFTAMFMTLTIGITCGGIKNGIEKWCNRLMPSLIIILIILILYVLTLDGAMEGVKAYLIPDFSQIGNPNMLIRAMGQAFFSLSLGTGLILVYGSYVSNSENIVSLGRSVMLLDLSIALLAGLLLIPAMFAAQYNGIQIFDANGNLIESFGVIFTVLPALFDSMGAAGPFVSFAFFMLISLAALTSTISILENPVAYVVESYDVRRSLATVLIGAAVLTLSIVVIFNIDTLLGILNAVTSQYMLPSVALMMCIFAGWIFNRNALLQELKKGNENAENGLFWKIWPTYVRFVCPLAILTIFSHQYFS
jgi:NSS family neurotransmitter:Na+ symporter